MNELGYIILEFALPFDHIIANTYFKKRESFNYPLSGTNRNRMDIFYLKNTTNELVKTARFFLDRV